MSRQITNKKKRIIWEKYFNQFCNHLKSMMSANIGSSLIELSSKNFASETAKVILELLQKDTIKAMKKGDELVFDKSSFDPIHLSFIQLFLFEKTDEKKDIIEQVKEILELMDFKQTNNSQNLIIFCAYFEAFLKQSIISLSKIDKIVFSKYVDKDKYDQLKKLLKISLKTNDKGIDNAYGVIKEIFGIRNIYVHNNGIVNNRFINFTGNNKIPEGKKFPLDTTTVFRFYVLLYQLMLTIFFSLSRKFFNITVKELENLRYDLK